MDQKTEKILDSMDSLVSGLEKLSIKTEKIGYVFDEKMLTHKDFSMTHAEKPERAMSIYMNLIFKGLSEKLVRLPSEEITDQDIFRIHSKEYLDRIAESQYDAKSTEEKKPRNKTENSFTYCYDTYDNYATYQAARMSAGSLLSCCKNVMSGKVDHAFAIIRPPGHHANSDNCRGFCFLNNVAIAADYLIKEYNLKVAIVDWDVHHGDGTQEIFYDRKNPLQISLHRHDHGNFYPNVTGKETEVGLNEGEGFNLNIPWNTVHFSNPNGKSSIGDDEYIYAFETIVIPVLKEYKPDVILVSCGFDAAENDPLGKMSVSPLGYAYMTHQLKKLSNKIIVALEGGYNLDSLSRCSEAIIRTLMNEPSGFNGILLKKEISCLNFNLVELTSNNYKIFSPSYYAIDQVNSYKTLYEKYWKSLADVKGIITPRRNILRKDDEGVCEKIQNMFKEAKDYLISKEEKESLLKGEFSKIKDITKLPGEKNQKNQSILNNLEFPFEFLKFKIGKETIPLGNSKTDPMKFKKRILVDNRTLSCKLNFRLDGVHLDIPAHKISNNPQQCSWVKRDGIFDVSEQDLSYLISKFLVHKKIHKNDLIEKLETLSLVYEKFFLEGHEKYDLYNVDILIIPKPGQETTGVTTRSKKKKTEFILKLNGVKEYSLSSEKIRNDENNFYDGLRSLINFIKENIME
jgi:acetoin utilization deacetylase AcuC-like enzyme